MVCIIRPGEEEVKTEIFLKFPANSITHVISGFLKKMGRGKPYPYILWEHIFVPGKLFTCPSFSPLYHGGNCRGEEGIRCF
jgi:hypothetical protein